MSDNIKRLIVNADDFGLTKSTNIGILTCLKRGIVTSTSLLTNGDAFEHAIKLTKDNDIDVGVHLTLMDGLPVADCSQVMSLVDHNGCFPTNYVKFARRLFSGRVSLNDVEIEWRSQIEKFLDTGLHPSHINGHNHVHMFPGIVDIVIRLSLEYGIKNVRIPDAPIMSVFTHLSFNSIMKIFLILLSRRHRPLFTKAGLHSPTFFRGLFTSGNLNKSALAGIIASLRHGLTELMCHPAFRSPELDNRYKWNYAWEDEVDALCDESIKLLLKKNGITLQGFNP
jgi:hopanoid biosynthesis associated protein HpnK